MKRTTLLLAALALSSTVCLSQDIITTNTGEDILARILVVGSAEIKYKKFDNPDGPVYTVLKSDLLMIRYEDGSKEIFKQGKQEQVKQEPKIPSKANDFAVTGSQHDLGWYEAKVTKYTRMKRTGVGLTIFGGILFVVGITAIANYSSNYYSTSSSTAYTGVASYFLGVAGLGTGVPLWIVGAHSQKKYTRQMQGISLRFQLNPQQKGLSLAYRF